MSGKAGENLQSTPASLIKAEVSIQVVRIGRKQMTLSVFRQLERDDEITGPIWGWVNYHPDNCADLPAHLHAVWQAGDKLKRATVHYHPQLLKNIYVNSDTNNGHPALTVLAYKALTGTFPWHGLVHKHYDFFCNISDYRSIKNEKAVICIRKKDDGNLAVTAAADDSISSREYNIIIKGILLKTIGEYYWLMKKIEYMGKELSADILNVREAYIDYEEHIREFYRCGQQYSYLDELHPDVKPIIDNCIYRINDIRDNFRELNTAKRILSIRKSELEGIIIQADLADDVGFDDVKIQVANIIDGHIAKYNSLLALWDEVKNSEQLFIAV